LAKRQNRWLLEVLYFKRMDWWLVGKCQVLSVEGWMIPLVARHMEWAMGRMKARSSSGNIWGVDADATKFSW
jgi:hypothetical protein